MLPVLASAVAVQEDEILQLAELCQRQPRQVPPYRFPQVCELSFVLHRQVIESRLNVIAPVGI